jgi:hypothetical protein
MIEDAADATPRLAIMATNLFCTTLRELHAVDETVLNIPPAQLEHTPAPVELSVSVTEPGGHKMQLAF